MKLRVFMNFVLVLVLLFQGTTAGAESINIPGLDFFKKSYPNLSFYYKNLATGETYSYRATTAAPAASTIKLPLALYVYELAAQNKINMNERLTYKSHHYYGGSGVIQKDKVGTSYSIKDLLKKSIVYSDNIAFIMLKEKVGQSRFIQYAKSIGGKVVYPGGKNLTTSKDLANYLEHLWTFSKKQPVYGNELIGLLKTTIYKDTVAQSLSPGQVAHKVGYIPKDSIYNDAAIIFDQQPYILVVMTQGIPVGKDVKVISSLAEGIHKEHKLSLLNQFLADLSRAEVLKSQLHKQISGANVTFRPTDTYNQTVKAFKNAKESFATLPVTEQKRYAPKLQNVELTIQRAVYFIDAISAGLKLEEGRLKLEKALNEGNLEDISTNYHALSSLIKRQSGFLYKVHGQSTREAMLKQYKTPAEGSMGTVLLLPGGSRGTVPLLPLCFLSPAR